MSVHIHIYHIFCMLNHQNNYEFTSNVQCNSQAQRYIYILSRMFKVHGRANNFILFHMRLLFITVYALIILRMKCINLVKNDCMGYYVLC